MANGKKKRSLREAFGTVSAPEEKSGTEPPPGGKTPSGGRASEHQIYAA